MSKNIFIIAGCVGIFSLFVFGLIQLTGETNTNDNQESQEEVLGEGVSSTTQSSGEFTQVDANEFAKIAKAEDVTVIDIRTKPEYDSGYIEGAKNMDFYLADFPDQLKKLDKDKKYAIYCRTGNRTSQTMKLMRDLGFQNVTELKDGVVSWQQAKNSLCTSSSC